MDPSSFRLRCLVLLAVAAQAGLVAASEPEVPMFSFSGFGTLGVVHSNEDRADFSGTPSKPDGAGYTRAWSASVDSLIAGQVRANLNPRLFAVLQVISEQNPDGGYRPHVEWANLGFRVTPDLTIRAGRMVLPALMVTETRKVGFANPWVRPPVEVYSLIPLTTVDGVDASYYWPVGHGAHRLQLATGRADSRYPDGQGGTTVSKARRDVTVADTFEQGFLTLRLNAGRAVITIDSLNPLFDAFRQFGPQGEAIANKYAVDEMPTTFFGVGGTYDPGKWFVTGEFARLKSGSAYLDGRSGWYVSGGLRVGALTPYLTFARTNANNLSDPGLSLAGLPPPVAGAAAGLNAALNDLLAGRIAQDTVSVGARWDFRKNMALKFQFDQTRIGAGSDGLVTQIQPGYQRGGKLHLFSASLDFVF